MSSIDLRLTEINVPRDNAPEPAQRHGDSNGGFSGVLNATLERSNESDGEDTRSAPEPRRLEKPSEKAPRAAAKPRAEVNEDDEGGSAGPTPSASDSDRSTDPVIAQAPNDAPTQPINVAVPSPNLISPQQLPVPAGAMPPVDQGDGADVARSQPNGIQSAQAPIPEIAPSFITANGSPQNSGASYDLPTKNLDGAGTELATSAPAMAASAPRTITDQQPPRPVLTPGTDLPDSIASASIGIAQRAAHSDPNAPPPAITQSNQPPAAPAPFADPSDEAVLAVLQTPLREIQRAGPAQGTNGVPLGPLTREISPESTAQNEPSPSAKVDGPARSLNILAPASGFVAQESSQQSQAASNVVTQAPIAPATDANDKSLATSSDIDPTDATKFKAQAERSNDPVAVTDPALRSNAVSTDMASATARVSRTSFHPIVVQVAAHVAQATLDGLDRISIRLSPADLGRIDVKLDFGPDGRVQAVFAADRAQTVDLLQRDARDLERALQDAGLRADSGSLTFNLRGEQRDGTPTFSTLAGESNGDEPVVEIAASQVQAYSTPLSAGRVDIRV